MATVEIHVKDSNNYVVVETHDIITARGQNFATLIADSQKATVRLRFNAEEANQIASKLMLPQTL